MSYSSEVLADSPAAWFRLEETTGAPAADSSGNGRTGDWFGAPTRGVAGPTFIGGNGFTLGGGAAFSADAPWNSFTGPFTLECWHKPNGSNAYLIEKYTTPAVNGYALRVESAKLTIYTLSASLSSLVAPSAATNGVWHHYAFTHDGTNGRLYIDGALVAGPTPMVVPTDGTATVKYGARGDDANYATGAGGSLDEVALYPSALSAARILAHYTAGSTSGAIAGDTVGTLPALTGSVAGTVTVPPVTGSAAVSLPALSGSAVGAYAPPTTGAVAAGLPALSASAAGTHVSNDQVGELSAKLPSLTGAVSGSYTAPPVSGAAAATLPALTAEATGATGVVGDATATLPALAVTATGAAGDVIGAAAATLPSLAGGVAGLVPNGVIPPSSGDPTVLTIDTEGGILEVLPPVAVAPVEFIQRPLFRRSVIVPDLTTVPGVTYDAETGRFHIPDDIYDTFDVVGEDEEVGVPHILFPDVARSNDSTYYRGGRTQIVRSRSSEPFGDEVAEVVFPQITSQDIHPDDPACPHPWTKIRANMEIVWRKSDGSIRSDWSGNNFQRTVGNQGKTPGMTIIARGTLRMAENDQHKPTNRQDPIDLGYLIPKVLNAVVSRRYPAMAQVTTGIPTTNRGAWTENPLGFVRDRLAEMWTLSGNQWTIGKVPDSRRRYELRLKKTVPEWTFTNGARGVDVDLSEDGSGRNVIYGFGTNDDGGTWRNTYYFDGTDPNDGIRLPLAADPRTQKRILVENGSGLMDNPEYDENIPVYADDVDMGQNPRWVGIRSAQQIIDREALPALTGRITLRTDPREGSRMHMKEGDKATLIGYQGRDVVLHIASIDKMYGTYEVTLEVDERSRDAMTLAQIRTRNKAARRSPARIPGNPNRRSGLEVDQVTPFDADSKAGIILPRTAPGGQWSGESKGWPFAGAGRITKTHFEAGSPFSVAIFAKPISAAHLQSIVGNPLTNDNPFEPHFKVLENTYGMVACWGQKGQRMGYSPGREDAPSPFTGDFDLYSTWEYVSGAGVKLWVYVFPQTTTTFSGRCYPGSEL